MFWAEAALLVVSGAAKARRPMPAATALRAVGVRLPAGGVRVLSCAEAAVGMAALLWGGRATAAMVAAAYALFVVFSVAAVARGGLRSCGCFGEADSPVGRLHVALTTAALAGAVAAIVLSPDGAVSALTDLSRPSHLYGHVNPRGC